MAISALQRQQDWGTQYLDDSGQWMQDDGGFAAGAAAANDEGGPSFGASDSTRNPALLSAIASVAASGLSGGALSAAQLTAGAVSALASAPIELLDPPAVEMAIPVGASVDQERTPVSSLPALLAAPTESFDPPSVETALSVEPVKEAELPFAALPPSVTPDITAATPTEAELDPAIAPEPTPTPAAPTAVDSAAIATIWNTYSATEPYRIYQAMDEHGWSDADVAQATGQTEQQVGKYLTGNGVQAGFGGAATVGRDAIDAPYLAAVTAAEADPPSQPDASRPWWTLNTPAPGAAFNEAGQMVDESGTVQPTMVFNLGTFTSWYESQGTPEAQAFAQMHGAFSVAAGGGLRFASGATVSFGYTEAGAIAPPAITWAMDKRIVDYAGYAKGDAFAIDAMRGMVDTPQNQQIIQLFGGAPVALPNNEMGERMRAMYGSDLATEMLQLTAATDAMKARYIGDMNAAISTPGAAGAGQALASWWTLDAAPPAQYGENGLQYDEGGQPIPQYTFNAAAYHAWYVAQPDPVNQLIGQVYGTELDSGAGGYRTTGAADSLNIQIGLDENGHATHATDTTLSNDLVRVNLADPKDMYDDGAVYFLPTQGFVTSKDNIKPETDFWDQIIPIIIVAAVSYFSAGTLGPAAAGAMGLTEVAATTGAVVLTTAGTIVSAAVAGAATSLVSGMLNDNLSLKGILQGALAGGLTAGLTSSLSSISNMGPVAGIATRATIQGSVQAIMGGSFKDGAIAGLASGVSDALSANINSGVVQGLKNGTMTAAGAITARYCASMLGSAIKIVACGSGAPGYAAAQAFLDSTFQQAGAPPDMLPANNPSLMGTTGQSLPAVAGDGTGEAVTDVPAPTPSPEPVSTQVLVDSSQSVSAVTDPSLAGTTGQALPTAAGNDGSTSPVADTPTSASAASDSALSGTTGQAPPSTPEACSAVTLATDVSATGPTQPTSTIADPALAGTTGQVPPAATDDGSSPTPVADTSGSVPTAAISATTDPTLAGTTGQAPPSVSGDGGDAASDTVAPAPTPKPAAVDRPPISVSSDLFGDPSPNNPSEPTGSDQQTRVQRDAETASLNAQSNWRASEIAQENAGALTQDRYQQLVDAFSNADGSAVDRSKDVLVAGNSKLSPGVYTDTLNGPNYRLVVDEDHNEHEFYDMGRVVVTGSRLPPDTVVSSMPRGAGELDASALYAQGLGDIHETVTPLSPADLSGALVTNVNDGASQSDFRAGEIAQQNAEALAQDSNVEPSSPTSNPSPEDAITQFRQAELASGAGTSVAGNNYVAQSGDNISRILGTSDPQTIGNFIRANGLTSSTLRTGQNYFVPGDANAYGDSAALGQAVLNGDNSRLAILANQRATQGPAVAGSQPGSIANVPTSQNQTSYGPISLNGDSFSSQAADDGSSRFAGLGAPVPAGDNLAQRFGAGVLGALKSVTVEPLYQARDLLTAGASVLYNEVLRDPKAPMWLPDMKSDLAGAYANGASQTRLLLQSNPITGVGVASYDMTTSAMNGDWGSVAEQAGGLAGGFAIGKGTSKFGGYGVSFENIGATGPGASQMGAVKINLVTPNSALGPATALDVGTYGGLAARSVGDGMSPDHIPSFAAIKSSAESALGRPLTQSEATDLRNNTNSILIDTDIHQQASRTYAGRNSASQISSDAADLGAAALRDQTALQSSLLNRGYSKADIDAAFAKLHAANRAKGLY